MALKPTIPPIQDQALASFPAADLASGTGIVQYFPIVSNLSTGNTYHLVDTALDSWVIETSANGTYNFDTAEFNLPRYVQGTAYLSAHFYESATSTIISLKLQHWDGSTATDMTDTIVSANGTNLKTNNTYLEVPITVPKMIKKGEQIRAVIVWVGNTGDSVFGTSPTNQTSPGGNLSNTQMIVGVPFRNVT